MAARRSGFSTNVVKSGLPSHKIPYGGTPMFFEGTLEPAWDQLGANFWYRGRWYLPWLALRGSLVISLGWRQGICSAQLKTFDQQFKIYVGPNAGTVKHVFLNVPPFQTNSIPKFNMYVLSPQTQIKQTPKKYKTYVQVDDFGALEK